METTNILYLFAGIGVLDTLYLIYHKVKGTDVYCLFFPKEWCRAVQYSSWSKTFGIPNSYAGFAMYVSILVLTYFFTSGLSALWLPIKIIIGTGFLFSMYFTFIQGFILKAFCTWCVISAINFTVMAVSVFILN